MLFLKNNGPRPPWSDGQILWAILVAWLFLGFTKIVAWAIYGGYEAIETFTSPLHH
jgi:ABC-type Na+ efflux pump permease subunit